MRLVSFINGGGAGVRQEGARGTLGPLSPSRELPDLPFDRKVVEIWVLCGIAVYC